MLPLSPHDSDQTGNNQLAYDVEVGMQDVMCADNAAAGRTLSDRDVYACTVVASESWDGKFF